MKRSRKKVTLLGRMGLRGRMVATAVAATAAALFAVLLLVGPPLRQRALARERETLIAEARLMAHVVEEHMARGGSLADLDPSVDAAASEVRARVTIVDLLGRVVADSAVSGADLAALENHRDRPEIREALASRAGVDVRRSATTGEASMYAAVAAHRGAEVVAIARVAHTLAGIEEQARDLRLSVAFSLILAFLITAALSTIFASSLLGPLREIMEAARRFGAGDLASRIRIERRDELGELARILNHAGDQLQQRLAELARDRARTDAILSAMEEGVLAVDHRGSVLVANDVLTQHFDLRAPLGRHYLEVIRQREVGEIIEGVLRDGERRTDEIEALLKHRAFAVTGVRFPGAEGAPHGAILSFHDITERRRLERIRRDFVGNASHELRTPLTSILGFVEALEDGAVSDPTLSERFLGKIRAQAERMTALADDLLALSRLESEEQKPEWSPVRPPTVADDAVAAFLDLATEKRITLTTRDEGAPEIVTDEERLRRIIENLVDNSVKYTPEGGLVEVVSAAQAKGGATIEVRDNGPGIAAEHLERVFERFYRVDKARSRELGGTGLGLAIVKHLAESIHAKVSVKSTVGQGSRFIVSVPPQPPLELTKS